MSDGVDRMEDASRILVWGTPRTTGRGGHMKIASIRTQLTSHERGAGDRPAEDRIPEETDKHGDSRWDIPRKRALFTSDGTDSTSIGSNTPESHADQLPKVKCSEGLITDNEKVQVEQRDCVPRITN